MKEWQLKTCLSSCTWPTKQFTICCWHREKTVSCCILCIDILATWSCSSSRERLMIGLNMECIANLRGDSNQGRILVLWAEVRHENASIVGLLRARNSENFITRLSTSGYSYDGASTISLIENEMNPLFCSTLIPANIDVTSDITTLDDKLLIEFVKNYPI